MNIYNGITGKYERVPDPQPAMPISPIPFGEAVRSSPSIEPGNLGNLSGLGNLGALSGLGNLAGSLGGLGNIGNIGKLFGRGGTGGSGGLGGLGGIGRLFGLGGGSGTGSGLGGLLSRINLSSFELEDIMLVAIFYLLYRESGDTDFLIMAGAMLFL